MHNEVSSQQLIQESLFDPRKCGSLRSERSVSGTAHDMVGSRVQDEGSICDENEDRFLLSRHSIQSVRHVEELDGQTTATAAMLDNGVFILLFQTGASTKRDEKNQRINSSSLILVSGSLELPICLDDTNSIGDIQSILISLESHVSFLLSIRSNQCIDLFDINIVHFHHCLSDQRLVGANVDDEDQRVVVFDLLHR